MSDRLNIDLTNEMYRIVSKLIAQPTRNTYRSATSDKNGPQAKVRESWTFCKKVVHCFETLVTEGMCANVFQRWQGHMTGERGVERQD